MIALISLIDTVIGIYIFIVFASVVLSWLVAFNVINTSNRFVYLVGDTLHRLTEPALGPIRRILPNMGALDLSPIVLLLGLYFLRTFITQDLARWLMS